MNDCRTPDGNYVMFCEACDEYTEFRQTYNKKLGHPWTCCECGNEYIPQNRKRRRETKRS